MVFWTTFIIGTFDQNTFLLVRKSKKFWENVRIWEKICRFETGTYFSISILFVFFFLFRLPLRTFWKTYRAIFRFFVLYGRKLYFGMRSWDQLEKNQKMCYFETGTYFSISILFVFFSIPITFTNFLENLSSHFFDFLSYMAGNRIF